jgi:hypothetical protein
MRALLRWLGVAVCSGAAVGCDGSSEIATSRSCETDSCSRGQDAGTKPARDASSAGNDARTPRGTDSGAPPADALAFCQRWVDAFAHYLETCRCDGATVQHFRDKTATFCDANGFFGGLTNPVAAGDLVYHPEAAAALFARLEAPNPECVEEPFRALKLDSSELYSFAGTFTGTHALGAPCTLPVGYKGGVNDCREGVCARNSGGTGGVCISLVGEGEECDASGDENLVATTKRLCFDHRPADSDGEYESAFDSLGCVPSTPGAATKVCTKNLADGQPCGSSSACRSGRCVVTGAPHDGVCTAKLADGAPCSSHQECASGACENGAPRVCGALLPDGEPCDYSDAACASGSCNDPTGGPGFCGPAPSRNVGQTCTSSIDCISSGSGNSRDGVCNAGQCIADICAGYL